MLAMGFFSIDRLRQIEDVAFYALFVEDLFFFKSWMDNILSNANAESIKMLMQFFVLSSINMIYHINYNTIRC